MHILLLGTAAGGGFPQWNCWCACCKAARAAPETAWPRTESSLAISRDGRRWFLFNASPHVREQLTRLPHAAPPTMLRQLPIEAVVLTDAELDHSLGLVLLREGRRVPLYATAVVRSILERDSRILSLTGAFAEVPFGELLLDTPVPLAHADGSSSGLSVEAVVVPAGPPQFAPAAPEGHTVGLFVRETATGHTCAYLPGCGGLTRGLRDRLARADVLLFDGTFWSDEEPVALGISARTARQMDHMPVGGSGGSLEQLSALPCRHRVYTHINNTNPILLEQSPERAAVVSAGLIVGYDGLYITV